MHRILAPVRRSGASREPVNPSTLCRSQAAQTGGDIVQHSTYLTPCKPWDGTRTGGGSCYANLGGSGNMIRNRSPPGVCWLTVCAVGGILKTFITIFRLRFWLRCCRIASRATPGLFSAISRHSVTRKFQKNFPKISPTFSKPCNRFLDEKFRYRGVSKSPRNF